MKPPVYSHRDLPNTAARRQKHLQFAAAYLEQARLDMENGAEGSAEWCMMKRRQHQQSLADMRAAR
jgi:hypothetical protein